MGGAEDHGRRFWPTVDGYEIEREIGRGGFAAVYEAVQQSVNRKVALKVLATAAIGPDAERRFRSECQTIGSLSWHPHVVALHDGGFTHDGRPFLAMELIPDGSLGDQLRRAGPLASGDVVRAGQDIAAALSAAHRAGIVHRDVKPDNMLIGREEAILLSDFGIATIQDVTQSATGSFSGTLAYCAPEIHAGDRATPASDLYSLGTSLYTLAAGRPAFVRDTNDAPSAVILRAISGEIPPLPAAVPEALAVVILRAMATDPTDRFVDAEAMHAALGALGHSPEPSRGSVAPGSATLAEEPTILRPHASGTPATAPPAPSMLARTDPEQFTRAVNAPDLDLVTVRRAPASAVASAPSAPSADDPGSARSGRTRILVVVAAAVLIVLAVVGLVVRRGGDDREGVRTASNATTMKPSPSSSTTTTTEAATEPQPAPWTATGPVAAQGVNAEIVSSGESYVENDCHLLGVDESIWSPSEPAGFGFDGPIDYGAAGRPAPSASEIVFSDGSVLATARFNDDGYDTWTLDIPTTDPTEGCTYRLVPVAQEPDPAVMVSALRFIQQ